ncbi:hypothetical protein MTY66_36810 [Mycolicibacterium sp. TY66]|uniref:DUF6602 domain-containing protein n=1 Tax=Mycobacteriaceae TaxID=1762 RepID=UPI001BB36F11|nr:MULTISPECIES: DUF6602 domain-containing protein [Mycolicibacterium]MCX8558007.1 hypothetical protein [Mycolicibacterium mucogenicum]BCI82056.1 hypothetical protein MTY66_36810 [Mycolicibacterium sp. TY66]BCJ80299.1 hypothetical protein MTY81_16720 [Mycolicibacterium sp. TY81]
MSDEQSQPPVVELRFHTILGLVEQELRSALTRARAESNHPTSIGDGAEDAVRDVLRQHLPSNYGVGKGHVYDAYGDSSRESDIVITNPDHPLSFPNDRRGTYVIEGVAAAGEVKSRLDASAVDDCIKKGTAFKRLRMTDNKSDRVFTVEDHEYLKQIGMVPPYFVIAFENHVAVKTLRKCLEDTALVEPPAGKSLGDSDPASTPQPPVDAICILGEGVWLYIRPDNPMGIHIGFEKADGSKTMRNDLSGWSYVRTDAPLVFTLAWLHASMPRIFRGASVFAPYLIPTAQQLAYMEAAATSPDAPNPDADDAVASGGSHR